MIRSPAIRTIVAGLVALDEELARDAAPVDGAAYTSAALPPMTSRRTFHEACRSSAVAGATKSGRVWTCPREAWHAARSRKPAAPALRLVEAAPETETDDERARRTLAAAGFRFTRVTK